jgi:hypothetical protein
MDTLKLYEDLAEALALEAARKIAGALGAVYEELRQSVTQADFAELKAVVADLIEAQSRTEQRVRELAEAQQRTELEVRALTRGLKVTREMVAGLADSVGYELENRAIARLPAILEAEHGVRVEGRLVRRFIEYPEGGEDEVNILGEGRQGEVRVSIVGEAKVHLAKRHIDELLRRVARLKQHGLLHPERLLVAVTHSVQPEVQRYADARGVVVVPSYRLEG